MNRTQRRAGIRAKRRSDARLREAKRRDIDADLPLYLSHDLGRVSGDLRGDKMPAVVRVRR